MLYREVVRMERIFLKKGVRMLESPRSAVLMSDDSPSHEPPHPDTEKFTESKSEEAEKMVGNVMKGKITEYSEEERNKNEFPLVVIL